MTNLDRAKRFRHLCELTGHEVNPSQGNIVYGQWAFSQDGVRRLIYGFLPDKEKGGGLELYARTRLEGKGYPKDIPVRLLLHDPTEADWRNVIIKAGDKLGCVSFFGGPGWFPKITGTESGRIITSPGGWTACFLGMLP